MAYERWSNGNWYAFHSCDSGDTKDDQVLSLWFRWGPSKDWTYAELSNLDLKTLGDFYPDAWPKDLVRARTLIGQFLDDIDNDFKNI